MSNIAGMALRTRAKPPASIEEILAATPKPAALIEIELERISHIAHMRNISYCQRMARPAAYPVKKVIGLTAEMAERIREFRFANRIDTENEAIRRLIELGLKAAEKQPA